MKSVLRLESSFLSDAERHVNIIPKSLINREVDPIAVSTLLVGDESFAVELRYKTCMEMFVNKDKIQDHKDRASFHLLSPTYDTALEHCERPRQYSSDGTS